MKERFYKFSRYLKDRFGYRVYKVSVDAGFSCPNKDGKFSKDSCIYCDNRTFSFNSRIPARPIEEQIKEGIDFGKKRYGAERFIVYFQAHTNTYAPLDVLKERYDKVKKFNDVVGISIGTRPDCVDEEILDLIKSYASDYEVWLEYGLQSMHEKTLEFINRQHKYGHFLRAVEMTKKRKIRICAHIIIGLPRERKNEILETAKELARLKIDGIKIHPLHIVKGTKLEELYNLNSYKPLELDEFVDITTEFLEYLWPDTVIQRIGADCPKELLVGPMWVLEKEAVLKQIEKNLKERSSYQGRNYKEKEKEMTWTMPLTRSI